MKIKILSLLCLVLSLSSCNKWLDVELIDRVDEDKLFSKASGFDDALAGTYSLMANNNLYGQNLTYGYIDTYAQYYVANSGYEKHLAYDYTESSVKSVHANIWNKMYAVISSANNILRWTDKNGSVLTEQKKNQVKGEAIAIRAFVHFDLIRMFCPDVKISPKRLGIPYNKIFGVSLPPQYTVEECLQLVLNDLNEAETFLANDLITTITPHEIADKNEADKYVARMNLYTVKAMKARLYIMRNDYENAIKFATEVIESNKFKMLDIADIDQSDANMDILFSDEHIFSLRNKAIPESVDGKFKKKESEGSSTPAILKFTGEALLYEANMNDVRFVKWFQPGEMIFLKYNKENTKKFFPKIPIIKLSEMYFIIAEASLVENPDKALECINIIRDHRIRGNKHWQYLTDEFIFTEMKRDFLAEGQIWFAYKRLNKAIPAGGVTGDIPPSNQIFVFPIPIKEIENGNRPQ